MADHDPVPEADALEQSEEVPVIDEDEFRRLKARVAS